MIEDLVRAARPADAFLLALLINSTHEPHFHTTASQLEASLEKHPGGRLVAEQAGQVVGTLSLWFPDFHPQHVWLGFGLHPDFTTPEVASALLRQAAQLAFEQGRTLAWTSVRADYLCTEPDLAGLGFREVHRTFGGGFYLDAWTSGTTVLESRLNDHQITLLPAAPLQHDLRLKGLYHATKADKVLAEPTISAAGETLDDPDSLWNAAFVAVRGEEVLGLALPERSGIGAWNAVLLVRSDMRRRGIGTALQARVCAALQNAGMTFLNTAGAKADAAYLGVLRRLGANIEPDWIAFEAKLEVTHP